ncbi:hypothetical protein H8F21_14105 [Pseudomonas sp. P66]|uniref:Uncharacterized protein n=1 Tax=Pseudomonas arcuscaelestis TaxID=2710591 RepID=A0ABS2BYK8_9PSED|nr:hypothetical protein [Pseudomonas arcuscaelestis]MBM5458698.1 hypothetical protein [Pseudomonas arcuscaelestis]
MSTRQQQAWCVISLICIVGLYFLLSSYTSSLENPAPMFWGLFGGHLMRVYFSVRYDLHAQSPKEVGLLSIAAVAAAVMAMQVRPWALQGFFEFESKPEVGEFVALYKEYFVAVHNPVFGIPAFFLALYWAAIKLLCKAGNRWPVLAYPRSSLEMYGAYYEAASHHLSPQARDAIEVDAKHILASSKGFYKGPSPNKLL